MRFTIGKKDNLMEYIPVKNPKINWKILENDKVEIELVNRGFFKWITQKFFKKPRISKIALEEIGSFIWLEIDGNKTVLELSKSIESKFGKKAEPIIDRMVKYLRILFTHRFIYYKKPVKNK